MVIIERDERDRKLVRREAFFNLMYSEKPISDLKTCMKKLEDGNASHQKCTKKGQVQLSHDLWRLFEVK